MTFGKFSVYGRLTLKQWLACWAFALVLWAVDNAYQAYEAIVRGDV